MFEVSVPQWLKWPQDCTWGWKLEQLRMLQLDNYFNFYFGLYRNNGNLCRNCAIISTTLHTKNICIVADALKQPPFDFCRLRIYRVVFL